MKIKCLHRHIFNPIPQIEYGSLEVDGLDIDVFDKTILSKDRLNATFSVSCPHCKLKNSKPILINISIKLDPEFKETKD